MYFNNTSVPANERFTKVFKKLNSSYQDRNSVTHLPQSSTDNSFYGEKSIGYSEDKQLKLIMPIKIKPTRNVLPMNQQSVLNVLFTQKQVMINRQKRFLRTQFVPTSNGLKYIMKLSDKFFINLSWLHSVQQLQKSKLLILYYDMYGLTSNENIKLPKIESLILQFVNQMQMLKMMNAVSFIHSKYHDENVQKLYHLLCGEQQKNNNR